MKEKDKNPYQLFNSYCLRTPLFSFSEYKKYIDKDKLTDDDFKALLEDIIFKESLFLASPDLLSQIERWRIGQLIDAKKNENLQITILKYFTRISTRCTPFGLFAGCSIGKFDKENHIELEELSNYKRITCFDISFLNQLFKVFLKEDKVLENILFYPNTSIYKVHEHYRYIEYTLENKQRSYSIEGINYSSYLEKILKKADKGKTIKQLSEIIVDKEITFDEAKNFIKELIENQILVSELEITLTGNDYFINLLNRVSDYIGNKKEFKALNSSLKKLDKNFGNSLENYKKIIEVAKSLVNNFKVNELFQTDIYPLAKVNKLNSSIKRDLYKAIKFFNKITHQKTNQRLEKFKKDFINRYEGELLPITLVLDTEIGIGYGKNTNNAPLLEKISLKKSQREHQKIVWTDFDSLMHEKLHNATKDNSKRIELTEQDFNDFTDKWNDLPDTFSSMIEVYKSYEGNKVFINGAGGSSATNLIGRFGTGNTEILEYLKTISNIENQIHKDKIIAEIVHLPEARTGNILQRPKIRDYEIPYLGKSSVDKDHQVTIDDVLVTVKNDKIFLYSKKHKKEVLPRLSNAHNFEFNSLPMYHFLCDMQTQNKRNYIGFYWNPIFLKLFFLPRVEFRNIIFSKARWNIKTESLNKIISGKNFRSNLKKWKKEHNLPNYVELVDGDNKLLIYLKNETSVKMLFNTVKKSKNFILEEFLFADDEIVKKGNKLFCNQFIVSFYNKEKLQRND